MKNKEKQKVTQHKSKIKTKIIISGFIKSILSYWLGSLDGN